MFPFLLLPTELQLKLKDYATANTILNLALCSRAMYELHVPFLYSVFDNRNDHTYARLARIIDEPELAKYVEEVYISYYFHEEYMDVEVVMTTERCAKIKERLVGVTSQKDADAWCEELTRAGYNDPDLAALLFVLFPNIIRLQMEGYSPRFAERIEFLLSQSQIKRGGILQRLKTLVATSFKDPDVREPSDDTEFSYTGYASFLRLSSVSDFHVKDIKECEDYDYDEIPNVKNLESNVTYLDLEKCYLEDRTIPEFMNFFNRLEKFRYVADINVIAEENLVAMFRCLRSSARSLREFVLLDTNAEGMNQQYDFTIGSLKEFTTLGKLEINSRLLLGAAEEVLAGSDGGSHNQGGTKVTFYTPLQIQKFMLALPDNLGHLIIRGCTAAIFDVMSKFLSQKPPNLTTIELVFRDNIPNEQRRRCPKSWEIRLKEQASTINRHERITRDEGRHAGHVES